MSYRSIRKFTNLQHLSVGPFQVKQPLPNDELDGVSPFILLHHGGPQMHEPGSIKARLSPHPHRGFEPVTFLFSGKIHHKDSAGNEGFLQGGDVQWMTAGSGIIHSEGPSAQFAQEGGEMELIQLWVNLPRAHKMATPKYQDIRREAMPVFQYKGFELRLVAGAFEGKTGPASTFTPILAMMVYFENQGEISIPLPPEYNSMVYVLDGQVESNGIVLDFSNLGLAEKDGEQLQLKALKSGRLLLLAGVPIDEPIASYGPFVMNYPGEIKQAILDYEMGKMGVLEN
jgi:hypothetical protein